MSPNKMAKAPLCIARDDQSWKASCLSNKFIFHYRSSHQRTKDKPLPKTKMILIIFHACVSAPLFYFIPQNAFVLINLMCLTVVLFHLESIFNMRDD